ncbi:glutaminase A [Cellulomonas sp.]|uniref:glutaminase A n=1 Tax=Cellulomonas sp. TaxID=40001 RepID=UPI002D28F392|nr:glutaminase A [Cellulomonas sp.]HYQ77177.1 glutaminase A [Cellulomonas sp.]
MSTEIDGVRQEVSTGSLPGWDRVEELVRDAHARYRDRDEGLVADYIPVLAEADPALFGVVVAETSGALHAAGDADAGFSIQSISKAFVYALACEALGHEVVRDRVGVNNTGLAFNSVIAVELNDGHPMNPMVNAGALATTALLPGATPEEQWAHLVAGLGRFAGRDLGVDDAVYASEAATNQRNRAIARLLESYGRIEADPLAVVDVYTRQCALRVDARDLAVMGATLADGGVNPVTGERVVAAQVCRDALAVLASTGMYERSGEWLFEIGLPAKSGVSGGIVAVAPGKGAIGTFSPRIDPAGNSVRGRLATAHLSRTLGLNLFASAAHVAERAEAPA